MRIGSDWRRYASRAFRLARKLKTLLITSPLPGDGKSTVALNLATVLSEKGRRSRALAGGGRVSTHARPRNWVSSRGLG